MTSRPPDGPPPTERPPGGAQAPGAPSRPDPAEAVMREAEKTFPEDLAWKIVYDPTTFVLATIKGEQIAAIGSQDMNDFVWTKLAKRAAELKDVTAGTRVVVTAVTEKEQLVAQQIDITPASATAVAH